MRKLNTIQDDINDWIKEIKHKAYRENTWEGALQSDKELKEIEEIDQKK